MSGDAQGVYSSENNRDKIRTVDSTVRAGSVISGHSSGAAVHTDPVGGTDCRGAFLALVHAMNDAHRYGPQSRSARAAPARRVAWFVLLALAAGLQSATQYVAGVFHAHPALGAHLGPMYAPWCIVLWALRWYRRDPGLFLHAGSLGLVVSSASLLGLGLVYRIMSNSARQYQFLHGSARWASRADIEAAGLLPRRTFWQRLRGRPGQDTAGVYIGAWTDPAGTLHYLRHNGPEHILTYAPTRSGKGVGLVIPTLLSWPHSAIITDLKGELWAMTAGWRQQYAHNRVIRFEPACRQGCAAWNPLDEIRLNSECEVGDVQNLATLIVDPDGAGLESHWQKTSQALLVGLILHLLYKARREGSNATLPALDALLSDPQRELRDLWKEMLTYPHRQGKTHPAVSSAALDMLQRPAEEAGSVLSTVKSCLSLYRDPVVAHNVSRSEFRIKDLMHHRAPVSLYIVTQPNDKTRLRPLVRVLINMTVRLLADDMQFERVQPSSSRWQRVLQALHWVRATQASVRVKQVWQHRLLGMIDEFPSLGKLDILQESLAFVAGYGIKFYLICQDINQLRSSEAGYGPNETISSNCHIQNAYPPNRLETAEHLSRLTGQTTIIKEQITTSGHRAAFVHGQVSRSLQEVQRALLTPDECLRMPGPRKDAQGQILEAGDMVVVVAGFPAIYGTQPLYFLDPVFSARAAVAQPVATDILHVVLQRPEGGQP